jgi:hypothetical protein
MGSRIIYNKTGLNTFLFIYADVTGPFNPIHHAKLTVECRICCGRLDVE